MLFEIILVIFIIFVILLPIIIFVGGIGLGGYLIAKDIKS